MKSNALGLYRDKDGWVMVLHLGGHEIATNKDTYIARRYEPPYDNLPSEEEYRRLKNK